MTDEIDNLINALDEKLEREIRDEENELKLAKEAKARLNDLAKKIKQIEKIFKKKELSDGDKKTIKKLREGCFEIIKNIDANVGVIASKNIDEHAIRVSLYSLESSIRKLNW